MFKLAAFILIAMTLPAAAHLGHPHGDIWSGALHPLTGADHCAAMVTVGAWSALSGGSRVWVWPLTFVASMLGGAALAYQGVVIPYIEQGITASLVIVGLLLALAIDLPVAFGAVLVGAFAIFHGYAHGVETAEAGALPFMAGFAVTTAALHAAGIGIARAVVAAFSVVPVRVLGAATASIGLGLLIIK